MSLFPPSTFKATTLDPSFFAGSEKTLNSSFLASSEISINSRGILKSGLSEPYLLIASA